MTKREQTMTAKHIFLFVIMAFFVGCKCNRKAPVPVKTFWGALLATQSTDYTIGIMKSKGLDLTRAAVVYASNYYSKTINQYLDSGYQCQINFNFQPKVGQVIPFPTDTALIRDKAEQFFKYYAPKRNLIPIVAIENEWDNLYSGKLEDYMTELRICCEVGHKYGFKVTDAAFTGTGLQRWNYKQLSKDSATWWRANYFVGLNNDYDAFISFVNQYATLVKNIPIDYLNVHWYNNDRCSGGYPSATYHWLKACGKQKLVCNEFGIKTSSNVLFSATVDEIKKGNTYYGVAYSGGPTNPAVELNGDMLSLLSN